MLQYGNDFFVSEFNHLDVDDFWFQHGGTTCHTAKETINKLKKTFGQRIISCRGPVPWLPKSCNLTPLDYFLWDAKSLVYADKSEAIDALEKNIQRIIADKRPIFLPNVVENWAPRVEFIGASHDGHFP